MINVNDQIIQKYLMHRHAVLVGSLLVFILFTFTLFTIIEQWIADWHLTHTPAHTPFIHHHEQAEQIATLPHTHLFGLALSGEVPISSLQLRVTGIVKTALPADSKVYISIAGEPDKIYRQGDSLPDGVKIYAITSQTVILENDHHLEKLPLPRPPLSFKPHPSEESFG
jgi:hypothetical protein